MEITSDGRPLEFPDNPLTRMIAGRGAISATPAPTVKSSAWGMATPAPEEQAELDAKLQAYLGGPAPETPLPKITVKEEAPVRKSRINFNNVQRIDLEREVIIVDDMEFPLTPEDARQLRLMCVDVVIDSVMQGLRDLLATAGVSPESVSSGLKEVVRGREPETQAVPARQGVPGEGKGPENSVAQGTQE